LNLEFGEVLKIGLYIHVHFWGQSKSKELKIDSWYQLDPMTPLSSNFRHRCPVADGTSDLDHASSWLSNQCSHLIFARVGVFRIPFSTHCYLDLTFNVKQFLFQGELRLTPKVSGLELLKFE
jgi:hypothetical protein